MPADYKLKHNFNNSTNISNISHNRSDIYIDNHIITPNIRSEIILEVI